MGNKDNSELILLFLLLGSSTANENESESLYKACIMLLMNSLVDEL